MKWERVNKYAMQSGEYRVRKYTEDEGALCTLYRLWYMHDHLKDCADFDQAKEVAEEHARTK